MPIDPNIILGAKAPQVNPLEILSQTAGIAGKLNENRLFQQQFGGKVALGEAAAGATKDGQLDARAMLGALAANPNGAFLVPEAAAQAQAREKEQIGIESAQLTLAKERVGVAAGAIYPLLGTDPNKLTKADVWKAAGRLSSMDLFKAPEALQGLVTTIQSLPEGGPELHAALQAFYLQANADKEGAAAAVGQPGMVNTGARNVATMTNPLTGKVTPTGEFATEIGPSETVEVYDPVTRQMKVVPKRAQFGATGDGIGGRPVQGAAAGPPLGASEAASVTGAKSAEQGAALQSSADQVPQRRATLMTMRDLLKDFTPGPKADLTREVGALATQFGLASPKTAKGVAAQEEFNKLSTQIVLQQVQQLGEGTDAKLGAGLKGNPSEILSKMGNRNVIALMIGNEDAINAKNNAWQKWAETYGPESYGRFTREFNDIYDPRVFQWQYMSTPDRVKLAQGMTKGEKAKFDEHARIAREAGWIK